MKDERNTTSTKRMKSRKGIEFEYFHQFVPKFETLRACSPTTFSEIVQRKIRFMYLASLQSLQMSSDFLWRGFNKRALYKNMDRTFRIELIPGPDPIIDRPQFPTILRLKLNRFLKNCFGRTQKGFDFRVQIFFWRIFPRFFHLDEVANRVALKNLNPI